MRANRIRSRSFNVEADGVCDNIMEGDRMSDENSTMTVYTVPGCLDCGALKNLLNDAGVPYREIDISHVPHSRDALEMLSGIRSVPQVYVGTRFIGQLSEIRYLIQTNRLKDVVENTAQKESP